MKNKAERSDLAPWMGRGDAEVLEQLDPLCAYGGATGSGTWERKEAAANVTKALFPPSCPLSHVAVTSSQSM